jgi:hypothetical protein
VSAPWLPCIPHDGPKNANHADHTSAQHTCDACFKKKKNGYDMVQCSECTNIVFADSESGLCSQCLAHTRPVRRAKLK